MIEKSLLAFQDHIQGLLVALFADSTTAIAYLKKLGGTKSPTLNAISQSILQLCESWNVLLLPQFIAGSLNVMADALSRRNQVLGFEWTLCADVFRELQRCWSVSVDLFSTNLNYQLPVYFFPVLDPMSAGTDAMFQAWDVLEVYACPPFALVHQVLFKLRQSRGVSMTFVALFWPQKIWFPELLDLLVDVPVAFPMLRDLLHQPHFHRLHQNLRMLRLIAWRLSSEPCVTKASLRLWLNNLPSVAEDPLG